MSNKESRDAFWKSIADQLLDAQIRIQTVLDYNGKDLPKEAKEVYDHVADARMGTYVLRGFKI